MYIHIFVHVYRQIWILTAAAFCAMQLICEIQIFGDTGLGRVIVEQFIFSLGFIAAIKRRNFGTVVAIF